MQNIEIWKDIPEYEGIYQVSIFGRVRSLDREIAQKGHKNIFTRIMRGKILTPRKQNNGYCVVWLSKNGMVKAYTIHKIVMSAFSPIINNDLEINHIDGDKSNNHLDNLEWVTHKANSLHAHKSGLIISTSNKKVKCLDNGKIYPSICSAAEEIGVTSGAIRQAIRRNQKSKGLLWKLL